MPHVITLTLPGDRRFATIARIVVGGLAARLDLPYEALDDLQLGVESVLAEGTLSNGASEVTLEVAIDDERLEVAIGPLDGSAASRALESEEGAQAGGAIDLRTVLAAVTDGVRLDEREDGSWVVLEKRTPVRPGA
jgi:hypothetical protein